MGRPNVGKSALFNRLAGRKIAIVHDMPGVTRDRISAECKLAKEPFTIFDTGGIGAAVDADFTEQVRTEVDIAIATSATILFVVDGQSGIHPVDEELARQLRRSRKPIILVVNKIDREQHESRAAEFSKLGFETVLSVSAEHGHGIFPLVDFIEPLLPPAEPLDPDLIPPLSITIVGRPNVGKSSLINAILHDKRTIVSEISGTTRDAVDIPYTRGKQRYVLIDTAGIRARRKVSSSVEVFSVMRSEKSIERADLCVLVIDASVGVTAMDRKIAGLIQEARKPCILAMNKWDLVEPEGAEKRKEEIQRLLEDMRANLFFLNYAPTLLLSAKTGAHIARLFNAVDDIRKASRKRIGTGPFNRLIQALVTQTPSAAKNGKRFKILYATQVASRITEAIPLPVFMFFVNNPTLLAQNYLRFIENSIRAEEAFEGLPLVIRFKGRAPRER